ncbi:hypothetical protein [Streptomyces inhibens]|uniref:hypothetical protein n=1 Tax=Streptomyces inhibens TaxID=2293571 RepID=UPI001EE6DB7D|nr:hypothetical protein [Streptomyces inhibens]UKY54737.1 hypothetical protein KI385_42100 [Streptomyces inhibens]
MVHACRHRDRPAGRVGFTRARLHLPAARRRCDRSAGRPSQRAPFYTKTDRTGYDGEHPLNTMLLDAAAETCLTAAAALRDSGLPDAARLAVDLVSWQPKWAGRLAAASRRTQGRELADTPIVPMLGPALEVHAAELPVEAGTLLTEPRRSHDIDERREALGVGFAEFNATLAGLAPPHTVLSHADAHREAIQKHLQLHRGALLDRLRRARLGRFDPREAQTDWRQLRTLEGIDPPAEWNTTLETATPQQVRARVEEALAEQLGAQLPAEGADLPAYAALLPKNRAAIRTVVPDLVALIRACRRPLPATLDHSDPAEAVTELLDEAGALDFRLLGPEEIAAWLSALGHWPAGMPASADPAVPGVTAAELENGRMAANSAWAQREHRQGIVTIGGKELDVHTGDFGELTAELQRALDADPQLLGNRNVFASLTPVAPGRRGASPGSRGDAGRGEARRLSAAQREAIGYAGEWFAYQWLRRKYRAANETSWVSTNRRKFFPGLPGLPGLPGDDGLGYDFRVGSGRQPLLFEVKASQGEGSQIERARAKSGRPSGTPAVTAGGSSWSRRCWNPPGSGWRCSSIPSAREAAISTGRRAARCASRTACEKSSASPSTRPAHGGPSAGGTARSGAVAATAARNCLGDHGLARAVGGRCLRGLIGCAHDHRGVLRDN